MRKPALLLCLSLCVAPPARAQHPMIFINGVRVERCETPPANAVSGLADIDPAAIESIEVLKGAAAIRQYGQDATNGVIQVTTKKGALVSPTGCAAAAAPGADPFAKLLYAPELVMAHQDVIGLTDRQRTAIQDAVKEMQSPSTVDTQFKLARAGEKLRASLARATVDEASVLQQIDEMLALEREVKRAQMTLLVRIKNQLTADQRATLDKLR
jgi:TonB-dependent SusC/RagA subfamily outer membrane receptor